MKKHSVVRVDKNKFHGVKNQETYCVCYMYALNTMYDLGIYSNRGRQVCMGQKIRILI